MAFVPLPIVLRWMPRPLAPVTGALALPFFVPALNSLEPPQIDLTGRFAKALFWITESGGKYGVPWVLLAATLLLVAMARFTNRERIREAILILLVAGVVLGICAQLNEHVIKPAIGIPRPYLVELARDPTDKPLLGMTAQEFYALPSKAERSAYLKRVLPDNLPLSVEIREHWIAETGYSFPSGHSFASMMLATFFMAVARRELIGLKLAMFFLMPVWATAVCLSRSLLRVHTPTDIGAGACEGIIVALLAYILLERIRALVAARFPDRMLASALPAETPASPARTG